jgi:predicted ferric reductase
MTDQRIEMRFPARGPRPDTRRTPRALRFGFADLLGVAAIASIVIVLWMWVRTQGILSLTSYDSAVGSLGLLTGLLSADFMLLQVVFLARIPWVEQAWGHDLLARRHKYLGYASFWLMIAHVGLFVLQRLSRDSSNPLATLWELFVTEPWMLWATIGTVLIILVVVSSIQIARRKLRYESWHLIHLYSYLGMAFALPHMIADGSDFHAPIAQIYWWSIYGITLATILLYRVGLPLWRSFHHRLRVESVVVEGPDVVSVVIGGRHLEKLGTKSGQFFIWRFLDGPGWTRGNPYTISAAPHPNRLRVTIQSVGDSSERAARIKPGTRVLIEGPYGTMTQERRTQPRMLVIAAGVGITPMRALLEDTRYEHGEADLIYRYASFQHAIFKDELDHIASERGVELHYLPGPRRADGSWLADGPKVDPRFDDVKVLQDLIPDVANRDVFLCGPPGWISSVKRALRRAGVPRHHIHSEDFAW